MIDTLINPLRALFDHNNPVVLGAVSLYIVTMLGVIARGVPRRTLRFLENRLTVSITIDSFLTSHRDSTAYTRASVWTKEKALGLTNHYREVVSDTENSDVGQ